MTPLNNVRRAVASGADRRFHYTASTLRLSQITTIASPLVMDYAWNDRGALTARSRTEPGSPPTGPDVIFLNGFDESKDGRGRAASGTAAEDVTIVTTDFLSCIM